MGLERCRLGYHSYVRLHTALHAAERAPARTKHFEDLVFAVQLHNFSAKGWIRSITDQIWTTCGVQERLEEAPDQLGGRSKSAASLQQVCWKFEARW